MIHDISSAWVITLKKKKSSDHIATAKEQDARNETCNWNNWQSIKKSWISYIVYFKLAIAK